jgi:hypothetical protein
MGAFTFASTADIPAFDFWEGNPIEGGSITGSDVDYTIDCLAESAKIRGASLPSRKSTYIITPFGMIYADIITSFSAVKTAKSVKVPKNKNTILLNLRI